MLKKNCTIAVALFIFFGCKKDSKNSSQTTQNTPPGTTTTTVILGGDHGVFLSVYNYNDYGSGITYQDSSIQASFFASPSGNPSYISAGAVSVNNFTLSAPQNPVVYTETNQVNMRKLAWQVSGSGTISPMSFSYTPIYPIYAGASSLPDSVTKSTGFNLNITGLSNTSSGMLTITQGGSVTITNTFTTTSASFSISPAAISTYSTGNYISIRLSLFHYANTIQNGKQYAINSNYVYEKYCYLK